MSTNLVSLIALLSPIVFALTALASFFQKGSKPKEIILLSRVASVSSILVAVFCSVYVAQNGLIESSLIGIEDIRLSIRLDSLSLLILGMIALLGFIIVKFSIGYLDGDPRHGAFLGRLAATIAAVQLLVISGNLGLLFIAWVVTSLCLHRLLLFYPERLGAQIAAKKKYIFARIGDLCLLIAIVLIYQQFGTGNFEVIFNTINNGTANISSSFSLEFATIFIAFAAILKSAQFPTHGWLLEVMETPTPVSALLHAGILNAGPFLVVRLSPIMSIGHVSPALLVVFGGFTALFASVVLLTQPSIKVALGYSSAAHMGFMLLVCGLGVYSAVILHLVAHSFYKAHAFLSSGSLVELAGAQKIKSPKRIGSGLRIALSFLSALLIYIGFAFLLEIKVYENPAILVIGLILVLGMSQIIAPAADAQAKWYSSLQGIGLAAIVATSFFTLEALTHQLLSSILPNESTPETITLILTIVVLAVFALTVLIQIYGPTLQNTQFTKTIYLHVRNGLYANDIIDKLISANKFKTNK